MTAADSVTCMLRVDDTNPGHTWVTLFVGRNPSARGHAGTLAFRTDELAELLSMPSGCSPASGTPFRSGERLEVGFDRVLDIEREASE